MGTMAPTANKRRKPRTQPPMPTTPIDVPPPRNALLRMRDVASRLQCSEKLVRRLTLKKGLRYTRIGREIRFKPEWVEEYIDRSAR